MKSEKTKLIHLYVKAYLSLVGILVAFIIVSIAQGAGWRPALAAMPLYVTLFAAITLKMIVDVVHFAKKNRENRNLKVENDGHS
jgi:hypothetical protein